MFTELFSIFNMSVVNLKYTDIARDILQTLLMMETFFQGTSCKGLPAGNTFSVMLIRSFPSIGPKDL